MFVVQAVEDRSQHMNRESALVRLRTLLALKGLHFATRVLSNFLVFCYFPITMQLFSIHGLISERPICNFAKLFAIVET